MTSTCAQVMTKSTVAICTEYCTLRVMTENASLTRSQSVAPLTDARERLSEIVDDVASTGADFVITKHGRPTAVVMGYDDYESLIETLNILSDADTMSALAEAQGDLESDDLVPLD